MADPKENVAQKLLQKFMDIFPASEIFLWELLLHKSSI